MNANNTNQDEHAKAWELLPWLANGTLDEWSRSSVERHAGDCATCREELELLRGIAAGAQAAGERPLSAEGALEAMMARIDREEATGSVGMKGWLARLSERFHLPPLAGVAVQATALLLLVGAVGWLWLAWSAGQQPRFQTLSSSPESASSSRPRVRVVFDERISVAEMGEILSEINGDVVEGPSPHGVYTVEVEAVSGEPVEVSTVIEQLRRHEGVRFAEPLGEGASGSLP